jgi:hypothetical protein
LWTPRKHRNHRTTSLGNAIFHALLELVAGAAALRYLLLSIIPRLDSAKTAAMDTSYLAQQVNTIIGQLHGLFDEIGVPSHERETREAEVRALNIAFV